jgi:hypothetical protein
VLPMGVAEGCLAIEVSWWTGQESSTGLNSLGRGRWAGLSRRGEDRQLRSSAPEEFCHYWDSEEGGGRVAWDPVVRKDGESDPGLQRWLSPNLSSSLPLH